MSRRPGWLVPVCLVAALGVGAGPARAQTPTVRLDSARTLVRNGEYDSAMAWINPVFQDARTTPAQRSRAFLLSAASLFMKENLTLTGQARTMLQLSLRADSAVRVDDDLDADVPGLRDQVEALRREIFPPVAARAPLVVPLTVQPAMLSDTVLPATDARFPIAPRPSRAARAVVAVARADAPGVVLWGDTLSTDATGPVIWSLRGRDGAIVPPGTYAVQVWAVDAAGERSPTVERVLQVTRVAVDTQPVPLPPTAAELRPESVTVRRGSAGAVLLGAAFGAAAAAIPSALGRPELNQGMAGDGSAYAVAGAVAVAGFVGFLAGHQVRYLPENESFNVDLRRERESTRRMILQQNAQALANAPIRVRLEGAP